MLYLRNQSGNYAENLEIKRITTHQQNNKDCNTLPNDGRMR